uniref:Ig-like domain-containing protein n=1 Tax=Myripristis murdjan TaxID=586833 RepID=A0A667ZET9_9TELE
MSIKLPFHQPVQVFKIVFIVFPLGQSQVVCSPQPIVALAGDDVILPCHLEPATSDFSGTVEWTREDLGPPYIHVHQSVDQNPSYKDRTSLFINKLNHGDVSLKLSEVKLSDEGRYRCFIPSIRRETFIQLNVGESARIYVSGTSLAIVGDDVILPSHLEPATDAADMPVDWMRPDLDHSLVHQRYKGQEVVTRQNPSYVGRTSLFTDKLKHGNVSLKLSEVKLSDEGGYRCLLPSLPRESFIELIVGKWACLHNKHHHFQSSVVFLLRKKSLFFHSEIWDNIIKSTNIRSKAHLKTI